MYKFTSDGRSLATGVSWKKGDTVPPGFPLLGAMLASKAIVEIDPNAQKGTSKPKTPETEHNYTDMTFEELADELRDRNLKISGNKQEKIDRLKEADEGGDN